MTERDPPIKSGDEIKHKSGMTKNTSRTMIQGLGILDLSKNSKIPTN